jgi:hypothetical protein
MLRALVALILSGLCSTALATDSSEAVPYTALEHRIAISVAPEERNQVLYEMREFLHDLYNINVALSEHDMKGVAISARPLSRILDGFPPDLRARLPETFLEIANGQREIFQAIERDAKAKGDIHHTLSQMAEAMTYCSGCHDTYRFQPTRLGTVR